MAAAVTYPDGIQTTLPWYTGQTTLSSLLGRTQKKGMIDFLEHCVRCTWEQTLNSDAPWPGTLVGFRSSEGGFFLFPPYELHFELGCMLGCSGLGASSCPVMTFWNRQLASFIYFAHVHKSLKTPRTSPAHKKKICRFPRSC